MNNPGLALGTHVQVGAILITEGEAGNMHIVVHGIDMKVERADIKDLDVALKPFRVHEAARRSILVGQVRIGSIVVGHVGGNLHISTSHTPSNAVTICRTDVDDFLRAFKEACHLESAS